MRTVLLIATAICLTSLIPRVGLAGAVPVTTHIVQKSSSADHTGQDEAAGRALLRSVAAAQSEITRVINDLRSQFEQSPELRDARSALRTAQTNYNEAVNAALAPLHQTPEYMYAADRVFALERKLAWGYIDDHMGDQQRADTAHELFKARQVVSRMDAQAVAADQAVAAARFTMLDANGALVGLQRSFQKSILSNSQYLEARASLDAARAQIAATR